MYLLSISVALLYLIDISAAKSNNCEAPPSVDYAAVTDITNNENSDPDVYSVGTRVTYACQFGYVANGRGRNIKCEETRGRAEWTLPQFSCTPQSCGDPGHIDNGHRTGSLFTFPNAVTYNCEAGYVLQGTKSRYCQTSGAWSGSLPRCQIISCNQPNDPENGQVSTSSYEYGSELHYTCNQGFKLNTDETVYCTEDGTWSRRDVTCEENLCDPPQKPNYGDVSITGSDGRPRAGSIAVYTCDEGRIANGPTRSKCLENGNWVFPTPECLEPCAVPVIPNGVIMRKETRYYRVNYIELKVGTQIEEDEVVYFKCSDRFEIDGSKRKQKEITCRDGRWTEARCKPASCNSQPPSVQNAYFRINSQEHNGTVSYTCHADFKKVRNELITCNHGQWIGHTPECISTKCSVSTLSSHKGFVVRGKSTYNNGEIYYTSCEYGYQMAQGHRGFICENARWSGDIPPCVARSCDAPPRINHGNFQYDSRSHGATATYECEDSYVLVGDKSIKCQFGQWSGEIPSCKDRRCFRETLQHSLYVSFETPSVTFSGDTLNLRCIDGFSEITDLPRCYNGVWNNNDLPLCKEKECLVPYIDHGSMGNSVFSDWYWSWRRFRYERSKRYDRYPVHTIIDVGEELLLKCNPPYLVLGIHGQYEARVWCHNGTFTPNIVCLQYGETPPTSTPRPILTTKSTHFPESATSTINSFTSALSTSTSEVITPPTGTYDENNKDISVMAITTTEPPEEECFCKYPVNDSNVVAQVDGMQLKFGDKVENGKTVVFRCFHIGFHHFSGRREINCTECEEWHSSNFPSCSDPIKGNTVILLNEKPEILMDGTVQLYKGQSAHFTCAAMETAEYPEWGTPDVPNISYKKVSKEREKYGDVLYTTDLYINDINYDNEGNYECSIEGHPKTSINVIVIDPDVRCPKIEEDGVLVIKYTDRRERSKVQFSCPPNREIIGKSELTCLKSGNWSDYPPRCSAIRCKALQDTDLLKISYSGNREIGSRATFHCFSPGKRSGESVTKCLPNGTWEHSVPTCSIPTCSVNDLLTSVPSNVEPMHNKENNDVFEFNSEVKLTCKNGVAEGNPLAICDKEGQWNVSIVECKRGCKPPTNNLDENIRLNPDKGVYIFGESVVLSCPSNMKLGKGPQKIMCFNRGWSPTNFPNCEYKSDDYEGSKSSRNKGASDY